MKKPARTDTAFYTYMSYLNLTKQMEYGGSQSLKEKRKWGHELCATGMTPQKPSLS